MAGGARPLLTVGLTGGIASGKSTVDAMFEELGAEVIDAAQIVHSDAALLVGTGADRRFDRLVVVACREETQLARLVASRGLSPDEALRRVRAQCPSSSKAVRADYTIENDGELEATRARVRD